VYQPHGFGKTLLVSAFEYILQGRRDLFQGLWIDQSDYDWKPCPVLRLDMNQVVADDSDDTKQLLIESLASLAQKENLDLEKDKFPHFMLGELLRLLYSKYNETDIAVLIDNYDAPTLKHINDPIKNKKFRSCLMSFYNILKSRSKYISHILLAGLTRFDLNTIFSGLIILT
jgi:hypothetical protein